MTDYQCGSCSYGSDDLDGLRQHSHRTGHVGSREKDGIETSEVAEAVEEAETTEGRFGKGRAAAEVGLGLLAAAAIGALAVKNGALQVRLAKLVAENAYLKSASGAGATLSSFRGC
ncbi:hypothetical protein ACIRRH_40680 [Kitasatospora sp. NPDC101235]|uniref:hypothetical protein n=1 Tax=Kitasatospora sp. NPDC101235 TaxID=3364101 RepID=UPI0037F804A6